MERKNRGEFPFEYLKESEGNVKNSLKIDPDKGILVALQRYKCFQEHAEGSNGSQRRISLKDPNLLLLLWNSIQP